MMPRRWCVIIAHASCAASSAVASNVTFAAASDLALSPEQQAQFLKLKDQADRETQEDRDALEAERAGFRGKEVAAREAREQVTEMQSQAAKLAADITEVRGHGACAAEKHCTPLHLFKLHMYSMMSVCVYGFVSGLQRQAAHVSLLYTQADRIARQSFRNGERCCVCCAS